MQQYYETTRWYREVSKNAAEGARNHGLLNISPADFFNTKVNLSMNNDEQQQIGSLFQKLDTAIELQQKQLDAQQQFKKAMLQKMFPKKGVKEPEMRFGGFEGEWEEALVGDMMGVTSVKRIHQSDWTDNGVRFLRARDIVSASKGEEISDYLYISKEKYAEYTNISGKVELGDLLVTGVGTIGIPLLIKNSEPIYFKDGNIIWLQNKNRLDGNFLYYSFIGYRIQKYISDVAGIGTVATYTIDSGKNTPIMFPSLPEQQRIGSFFKSLDDQISDLEAKLAQTKQFKQALLQKMFI